MPVAAAASVAAALTVLAWAYLAACHGGYWRTDQRLPPARRDPAAWPDVTAIVPARDEAAMLPATMPALLAQDYPGTLRVVLVDDESADGTADVAAALGRAGTADGMLRVVRGGRRPAGWAGKVWAMQQGLAAADWLRGNQPETGPEPPRSAAPPCSSGSASTTSRGWRG